MVVAFPVCNCWYIQTKYKTSDLSLNLTWLGLPPPPLITRTHSSHCVHRTTALTPLQFDRSAGLIVTVCCLVFRIDSRYRLTFYFDWVSNCIRAARRRVNGLISRVGGGDVECCVKLTVLRHHVGTNGSCPMPAGTVTYSFWQHCCRVQLDRQQCSTIGSVDWNVKQ